MRTALSTPVATFVQMLHQGQEPQVSYRGSLSFLDLQRSIQILLAMTPMFQKGAIDVPTHGRPSTVEDIKCVPRLPQMLRGTAFKAQRRRPNSGPCGADTGHGRHVIEHHPTNYVPVLTLFAPSAHLCIRIQPKQLDTISHRITYFSRHSLLAFGHPLSPRKNTLHIARHPDRLPTCLRLPRLAMS